MKTAVLMSGGVDSSLAALLLQEQGHEIIGLTMINWHEEVAEKGREAAELLGIQHYVADLRVLFQQKVIDYFCKAYEKGDTPNPCVECNRHIKFGALLDAALRIGCDKVATGHYARVEYDDQRERYLLRKGLDVSKDQSYFLWALNQDQLSHIIFPLGEMRKEGVKRLAREKGLPAADSRESQEICFIENDYRDFIRDRIYYQEGEIVDRRGQVLGRHQGLPFYTVGQRRGLGIAAGSPVYVCAMEYAQNRLILDQEETLYKSELISRHNNYVMFDELQAPMRVNAKIRYAARAAEAVIYPLEDGNVRVEFTDPQRAITPGQSVVYYQGDYVVGGGIIV
ncbi:tRNA 2-thiouridine(34) synthase MnmA [Syntrophomonas palmitatica]|uniref:tRNA 2-thiouridine(34) synthase MnmA n=1 Tax=Syntrophomonas palmitatica TaxID=402877 RepID=UPI000AF398B1|nr:tRNA 2-thiouridine(34) synthase MnmA [Syntrophomonas palmitatica]